MSQSTISRWTSYWLDSIVARFARSTRTCSCGCKKIENSTSSAGRAITSRATVRFLLLRLGFSVLPLSQRLSGSDFLPRFYEYHRDNPEITIFLLGGLGDVSARARDTINRKVGRDIVVGCYSPPVGAETSEAACREMVDMINASKASVLVVGLGTPKQERFLKRYRDEMPHVRIFLPLGGAVDYEAGTMKRPPAWLSNMGLEWAYRILQEPRKRWRRYLVNDMPVIPLIFKQKMGLYRNPFEVSHAKEGQS